MGACTYAFIVHLLDVAGEDRAKSLKSLAWRNRTALATVKENVTSLSVSMEIVGGQPNLFRVLLHPRSAGSLRGGGFIF
jgi:hypothetical protein